MSGIQLPPSGLAEEVLAQYGERTGELHLVTFNLGEVYGVPIHQVQEIVRIISITKVPNSLTHMEGVINLRGRVLPVLNLRKRLKLPPGDLNRESRIIVAEIGSKIIGLLVDAVSHVIKVPSRCVEDAPEEVLEIDTDYLTGVAKVHERLVILLDLEKLLKRDRLEMPDSEMDSSEKVSASEAGYKDMSLHKGGL